MTLLVFDMDGTIADLYGVPNWLEKLRAENPEPYQRAHPMWDMDSLARILNELKATGEYEIAVVTWLSKNSSESYKGAVRKAKREWLAENGFPYDYFHGIQYGATKANAIRGKAEIALLFDDDARVRKGWTLGETIDPTTINIINYLSGLLDN